MGRRVQAGAQGRAPQGREGRQVEQGVSLHEQQGSTVAHRLPPAQKLHEADSVGLERHGHHLEGLGELRGGGQEERVGLAASGQRVLTSEQPWRTQGSLCTGQPPIPDTRAPTWENTSDFSLGAVVARCRMRRSSPSTLALHSPWGWICRQQNKIGSLNQLHCGTQLHCSNQAMTTSRPVRSTATLNHPPPAHPCPPGQALQSRGRRRRCWHCCRPPPRGRPAWPSPWRGTRRTGPASAPAWSCTPCRRRGRSRCRREGQQAGRATNTHDT